MGIDKMKYTQEIKDKVVELASQGDSVQLICAKIGISRDCFYRWKKTKKEFSDAFEQAKREFLNGIAEKLEESLWKRAMGFEVTETETEYVNDGNGQPQIKSQKTKTKYFAPDTGALVFALTNVAPERWKNKQRVETAEVNGNENEDNRYFENLPPELQEQIVDYLQDSEHMSITKKEDE